MRITPLTTWPTTAPNTMGDAALQASADRGCMVAADVSTGTRSLLPLRWIDSSQGWRAHPAGPADFDSAAATGTATAANRYARYQGDTGGGWWALLDLGGTGTLSAAYLSPVNFY